jgi:hypothetical protein
VCKSACKIEFIKQVWPMLLSPRRPGGKSSNWGGRGRKEGSGRFVVVAAAVREDGPLPLLLLSKENIAGGGGGPVAAFTAARAIATAPGGLPITIGDIMAAVGSASLFALSPGKTMSFLAASKAETARSSSGS